MFTINTEIAYIRHFQYIDLHVQCPILNRPIPEQKIRGKSVPGDVIPFFTVTFLRFFWAIFQYNFGDSGDVHGMRHIKLRYLFPTVMMEIRTFHSRIPLVQVGQFSIFKINFKGPMKWDLCLLI